MTKKRQQNWKGKDKIYPFRDDIIFYLETPQNTPNTIQANKLNKISAYKVGTDRATAFLNYNPFVGLEMEPRPLLPKANVLSFSCTPSPAAMFLHGSKGHPKIEIKKAFPFKEYKRIKYLWINFSKEVKDLYIKDYAVSWKD